MNDYHAVFEMSMPIRWGDMDAFGHVNNTVYFRYMEQVRISWFEQLGIAGGNGEGQGPVIVNASMEFLKQLHYPGDVIGRMSVGTPGRSSFDTRFRTVSRRRSRHRSTRGAPRAACGSTTRRANRCRFLICCAEPSRRRAADGLAPPSIRLKSPKQPLQQLGRVARVVFAHQPRAVDIDGARADIQRPPDLLAGLAGHELRGDFPLARRQFDRRRGASRSNPRKSRRLPRAARAFQRAAGHVAPEQFPVGALHDAVVGITALRGHDAAECARRSARIRPPTDTAPGTTARASASRGAAENRRQAASLQSSMIRSRDNTSPIGRKVKGGLVIQCGHDGGLAAILQRSEAITYVFLRIVPYGARVVLFRANHKAAMRR